jgi:hypothetical protein
MYNLMKIGLILPTSTLAKANVASQEKPLISYYSNSNGSITFGGLPANANLFIYDISGNLVRNIAGNYWDGRTNSGAQLAGGFYVTNVKTSEGVSSMKVLKK